MLSQGPCGRIVNGLIVGRPNAVTGILGFGELVKRSGMSRQHRGARCARVCPADGGLEEALVATAPLHAFAERPGPVRSQKTQERRTSSSSSPVSSQVTGPFLQATTNVSTHSHRRDRGLGLPVPSGAERFGDSCGPPVTEPGAGEVRVRIVFSGVNPTDWKSRRGSAQEHAVLPAERIFLLLPANASFDQGASLGVPAITAHRARTVAEDGPRRSSCCSTQWGADVIRAAAEDITAALVDGVLAVGEEAGLPLHRTDPAHTADTHALVESGVVGKVLIDVSAG